MDVGGCVGVCVWVWVRFFFFVFILSVFFFSFFQQKFKQFKTVSLLPIPAEF